jgi:hypothetical protein
LLRHKIQYKYEKSIINPFVYGTYGLHNSVYIG